MVYIRQLHTTKFKTTKIYSGAATGIFPLKFAPTKLSHYKVCTIRIKSQLVVAGSSVFKNWYILVMKQLLHFMVQNTRVPCLIHVLYNKNIPMYVYMTIIYIYICRTC